jgi:hypothetical protein
MDADRKLPRLLGSEPDIKLNEKDTEAKINTNFKVGLEESQSHYQNNDKINFYDYKKTAGNESRLVKLTSGDIYEVNSRGTIRALHSNETITTAKAKGVKSRPHSSKYVNKRPWSNRSYRRGKSGESKNAYKFSSNRNGFHINNSSSLNSQPNSNSRKVSSHLSRVNNIIGQADKFSGYEQNINQMPKKYCRLRTQETIDANLGVYGTNTTQQVKPKTRSSIRSIK